MKGSGTNSKTIQRLAALTFVLTTGLGGVAGAGGVAIPQPTYERSPAKRPAAARPAHRGTLPEALRALPAGPKSKPDAKNTRPGHALPSHPASWRTIDRQANLAAGWTARELVEIVGRREYYRVGFHEGQREALHDPVLGDWDFTDGRRYALRSPRARQAGASIGESAAEAQARLDAERQVTDQFLDLNRDPRYRPEPAAPFYRPPATDLPAPTLDQLFSQFPLRLFEPLRGSYDLYLADWSLDGHDLYACETYTDFHDSGWKAPQTAFSFWLVNPHRSRFYRSLASAAERRRFETVFAGAFETMIYGYFDSELALAYECGFDEGYSYGAFIHTELDYRRGYHEGFQEAVAHQAQVSFRRGYDPSYEQAYELFFDDWTHNAKPAIGEIWLKDGNADGVFEPGEQLLAVYELINYGGEAGRFPIVLAGRSLDGRVRDTVELPPRAVIREERPLEAQIDPRARLRSKHELSFTLAELSTSVPLWVSRPLAIERGSLELFRDNLAGELIVEIAADNTSLRPLEGTLALDLVSGGRPAESKSLTTRRRRSSSRTSIPSR